MFVLCSSTISQWCSWVLSNVKQCVAITGRNSTGPPCSVGRPIPTRPVAGATTSTHPAGPHTRRRGRQTTIDASQQNNTGPLGGPVISSSSSSSYGYVMLAHSYTSMLASRIQSARSDSTELNWQLSWVESDRKSVQSESNALNTLTTEKNWSRRKIAQFLRNVTFTFAIMLSLVSLSSVTFVRPTQPVEIFGNISTPFGTVAIRWHPLKILRRSSKGNSSVGWGLNARGVAKYSYFGAFGCYMSETMQDWS